MKILFYSQDLVGGNLARLLKKEGNNVCLYINDKNRRENFSNLVKKTTAWKKCLADSDKKCFVVFDCSDFGKTQDMLRKNGYSVFGGCEIGDKLETDREYGFKIFSENKIKNVPIKNFSSINNAIDYIKKNPDAWVIKQNGEGTGLKSLNYVGMLPDGRDAIDVLEKYNERPELKNTVISLQKKIEGIEIAVGRFFNGKGWVGPICLNIEHKKLFPDNLGPTTSEMGTIVWYVGKENKLYRETLKKLEKYLSDIDYRGYIDINCMVNKSGIYPLEATARLGSPIVHLQSEIHESPWGEFLKAIADGKDYKLKWKKGYGIVVVVTVPTSNPFPFTKSEVYTSPKGINIYFDKSLTQKDFEHIHFEDVSMKKVNGKEQYYISDDRGYVLYVTAMGKTVEEARRKAYGLIKKIHIPKMFYRNDIGLKFINEDENKLRKWGYL